MSPAEELRVARARQLSRRWFLRECGVGLGGIALAQLMQRDAHAAAAKNPFAPKLPPQAAKAKRVIFLFHAGAPSHLDLFDHKPELTQRDGQLPPAELLKNYRAAFINGAAWNLLNGAIAWVLFMRVRAIQRSVHT